MGAKARGRASKPKSEPPSKAVLWQAAALLVTGLTSIAWMPVSDGLYPARYAAVVGAGCMWVLLWATGVIVPAWRERRFVFVTAGVCALSAVLAGAFAIQPATALTWGDMTRVTAPVWVAWVVTLLGMSSVQWRPETRFATALVCGLGVLAIPVVAGRLVGFSAPNVWINSNYLGPVAVLFAPLALGLAATAAKSRERTAWRIGAGVLLASALLSTSVAAAVGAVVAATLVLLLAPGLIGLQLAMRRRLAVLTVGFALLVGGVATTGVVSSGGPLGVVSAIAAEENTAARLDMWRGALAVAQERPLLGAGPDQFAVGVQPHLPRRYFLLQPEVNPVDAMPGEPHNLPLSILAQLGVVGLLSLLGLCLAWAWAVKPATLDPAGREAFRTSCAIATVSWFACVMFTPVVLVTGSLPALLAGLALVGPTSGRQAVPRAIRWSVGGVLVVVGAWLVVGVMVGWPTFVGVKQATSPTDYHARLARATSVQPAVPLYGWLDLCADGGTMTPATVEAFHSTVDGAPPSVREFAPYLVYLVSQSLDEAETSGRTDLDWEASALAGADAIAPNYPVADMELIRLAILAGDKPEAQRLLRASADLQAGYPEGYGSLADSARAME